MDDRRIINAILYVLGMGVPWRQLPLRYGPYTTAYNRFNRWSRRHIWRKVAEKLVSLHPGSEFAAARLLCAADFANVGIPRRAPQPRVMHAQAPFGEL